MLFGQFLGGDVEPGSKEEKTFNKIDLSIFNTGSLNHSKVGFEIIKEDEKVSQATQYLLLRKKSVFLRRLQNSQGKGTAYGGGDDADWE